MGAQPSFRSLYDGEFAYVWRCLRRLGIPLRDRPDVAHEVFIRAHASLARFDWQRPLRPWLMGIAFRVASTHLRLHRHRYELLDGLHRDRFDDRSGQEQRCIARERLRAIERVLLEMSEGVRAAFVMHVVSGVDPLDVARTLEIPGKTVYSRLRLARARIEARARQ